MTKEARMTNVKGSTNAQMTKERSETPSRHSDFVIPSGVGIRHSALSSGLIATSAQLTELLEKIEPVDRVAIDTEADSLHCYREKLCLLQVSLLVRDRTGWIERSALDANLGAEGALVNIARRSARSTRDYDLRLLRRSLNFAARRIFDTVIAARLLGIREFSLAALVERFFGVELAKGSQK